MVKVPAAACLADSVGSLRLPGWTIAFYHRPLLTAHGVVAGLLNLPVFFVLYLHSLCMCVCVCASLGMFSPEPPPHDLLMVSRWPNTLGTPFHLLFTICVTGGLLILAAAKPFSLHLLLLRYARFTREDALLLRPWSVVALLGETVLGRVHHQDEDG